MPFGDNLTHMRPVPRDQTDQWLSPEAVIANMAKEGEPVPCGWAPLDARLRRGGLTPGRVYAVGGPPFTGKTTIVVDIALGLAQRIPVFALFSDEGITQAAARMAVMLGVAIESVEGAPLEAAQELSSRIGERSLLLGRPDSDFANVSAVFDHVSAKVPKGQTAAIVLDSVQTIAPDDQDDRSERERILRLVQIVRRRAEDEGRIAILTSQSNRASYRNRAPDENSVAMSSFSGAAIEFAFDVGIVLSLPDESSEVVRVDVVKNRLAHFRERPSKVFHVKYCPDTGRMLELDQAAIDAATTEAGTKRMRPIKSKLLEELKKHRDGLSASKLQELTSIRRIDVFAALRALVAEQKVYAETRGRGVIYTIDTTTLPS